MAKYKVSVNKKTNVGKRPAVIRGHDTFKNKKKAFAFADSWIKDGAKVCIQKKKNNR